MQKLLCKMKFQRKKNFWKNKAWEANKILLWEILSATLKIHKILKLIKKSSLNKSKKIIKKKATLILYLKRRKIQQKILKAKKINLKKIF